MGFSLKETANMLVKGELDLKIRLKNNFGFVQEEQKKFNRMESVLQAVVYSVDVEGELDWKVMFELIQLSKQSSRIREIFQNEVFSKEEQNCFIIYQT